MSHSDARDREGSAARPPARVRRDEVGGQAGRKGLLPPPRRQLLRLIEKIEFGVIENLMVRDGQPVWEPFPTCIQSFPLAKAAALVAPPPDDQRSALKDVELKLFEILDHISGAALVTIHVQDRLPVNVRVKHPDEHWLSIIIHNN